MAVDVPAVQQALNDEGLDGWLLYDFQGLNPIAARMAGIGEGGGHLATRRWFYLIPASGEPRGLVHAIERHNLDHLPGRTSTYAGRAQLESGLAALVNGVKRLAMEYSPANAIPYVSRVDAGTLELVRQTGVDVASSGDLVQRFDGLWDAAGIESHRAASEKLYRIKDQAFELVSRRLRDGTAINEFEVQQAMAGWFADEGLVAGSAPNVSAQENAGNPHYLPTASVHRPIRANELLLLDLWGRFPQRGSVYADITWVAFTGPSIPSRMTDAFAAIVRARDAAVALVQARAAAGEAIRGFELDRAARQVIVDAGYGDAILHRTGHSLGEEVHGNGAHLDDYETHDERRLMQGSIFTVEPGVYFSDFGVRTEINVVWDAAGPRVTGPSQTGIISIG
ncbi:MAG: aminopeptidase P family protein [Acidobacteria bacterium]|nr:aminopeptidase P family protein [Acidobacteriota bacterium]